MVVATKNTQEISYTQRILWICNTLFHQAVAVITVFVLWVIFQHFKINQIFTWHMVFCAIAYLPLMAEAVILFAGDNLWSQKIPRPTRFVIHGTILFLSAVSVTVGISIFIYEIGPNGRHFHEPHGVLGLVSWLLVLFSTVLGAFSAKAQQLKFLTKPVHFKLLHNVVGILAYTVGMISLGYAIFFDFFEFYSSRHAQLAAATVLGVLTFWSLLAPFKSVYNQIKVVLGM